MSPVGKLEIWGSFTHLSPHSALSLDHSHINPSSPFPLACPHLPSLAQAAFYLLFSSYPLPILLLLPWLPVLAVSLIKICVSRFLPAWKFFRSPPSLPERRVTVWQHEPPLCEDSPCLWPHSHSLPGCFVLLEPSASFCSIQAAHLLSSLPWVPLCTALLAGVFSPRSLFSVTSFESAPQSQGAQVLPVLPWWSLSITIRFSHSLGIIWGHLSPLLRS